LGLDVLATINITLPTIENLSDVLLNVNDAT